MPEGYSWSDMRGGRTYRLPGPEHLGWWAAVAMERTFHRSRKNTAQL